MHVLGTIQTMNGSVRGHAVKQMRTGREGFHDGRIVPKGAGKIN